MKGPLNRFVDETISPKGEPIEYEPQELNRFLHPPANGLTVEEIEYDEYLIALEEWRRKNKQAEE